MPYKKVLLDDGILSYDCTLCGHSDLEKYDAQSHARTHVAGEIDIIASGYEFICPGCLRYNKLIVYIELVECENCGNVYEANPLEHVYN